MKKIAYILHGLGSGGTESFVINVISKLDKKQYDITGILALDGREWGGVKQFREDEVRELGVHIYRTCDLDGIKKKYEHYRKTIEILKKHGPYDVVHANMDLFNGINLLAAKNAGVPLRICHSHNSESQYATSDIKRMLARTYRFFMRRLIKGNSTLKLGCSELACEYLYGKNCLKKNNCEVLYNGIDLGRYQNRKILKNEYLVNNKIPLAKYNLMTVGRFAPQKNPYFILDILTELKMFNIDFHFTWVGIGNLMNEVISEAGRRGLVDYISFLGARKDVPELMKCHEIFVFPSIFEGLPITLIEAQAAGMKCLVSDSVTKEVDAGLCTYLPLKNTAKEWARELLNILENKDDKKSLKQNRVEQFNIETTVNRLIRFYNGEV